MEERLLLLGCRRDDIIQIKERINTLKRETVKKMYSMSDDLYEYIKGLDKNWINLFYEMIR